MLVAGALAATAAIAAPAQDGGYARHRILVEARPGLSDAALDRILKEHGGKKRKIGQSRLHVVDLPANASEVAVVAKLQRRPELKFAELDRVVPAAMAVNDPYAGSEWHLTKIGAQTAWDSSMGRGVTIAVLDSGVNVNHPDLKDHLVAGYNVYDGNTDLTDVCGHGTAVAGTAAATSNNATGVAGVAGAASVMPLRIAYSDSTGCHAYFSTIASGITYAADHGARIANISYVGIAGSSSVLSAARYMNSKGGLVFVSAGNNNIDENVTPDPSLVVVSATDANDAKASFSSWGSFVTISAPGTYIWTTNNSLGYSQWNGTSFSAPVTAGVAALMMAARPDLSGDQIQSLLYSTSVDLGAAGRDPVFGYGRVDAAAALRATMAYQSPVDTTAPVAAIAAPLANSSVSGLVGVTVNASDNVGVARVDLKVNGTVIATDTSAPYTFSWDSTGTANGMANIVAVAYDAAGNAGTSATVAVNVANQVTTLAKDTTPPSVVISNPVAGTVTGNVAVSINASDDSGAAGITTVLSIDGQTKAQGTGGVLGYNWNTRKVRAGQHTLTATSRDAAGNTSTTSVIVTSK
ncbi:S8 family serine peptidase [Massilia sp. TW-1]|uniref:S8 family serine peptidase n=2 Tax=Telluria antibiotica TaxID=2717319 RepID=A0ABX0P773_9BURK|nr:S8 family serine peptidase [Telluria antibiotica]